MSKKTHKESKKKDPFAAREAKNYERPIPSREFILSHLKSRGKPANFDELKQELTLVDEESQEALRRRLKAMIRDHQVERLREGRFWPAGKRVLIKGRVQIEKGHINRLWVMPDDGGTRILLASKDAPGLYQGNRVIVSVIDHDKVPHALREGHIVEILEQKRMVVTGRFVEELGLSYVIPHGKEISQDILIPQGKTKEAKDGHIVVVELLKEVTRLSEPLGQVIEVLGHEDTPGIEIQSAVHAYGLSEAWPASVLDEIKDLQETISSQAKVKRLDIRHLPLVTIDGEDAKDFDDAVYCEQRPKGGWQLYVAIADVSHYVSPSTALDIEAKLRGTSVYFPGKVIPMLPEVLSNGLCSLKPEVERLCLVCILTISPAGNITKYEFHEGLMQSHARLTYTKVAAILSEQSPHLAKTHAKILPQLKTLESLYLGLKKAREERGAIDFETIETRIIFGKNGKISQIEPIKRNDAHRIIEECMLAANVATARFLKKHKLPGLYRVHEGPPEDKLSDLKLFLSELGLTLGGGNTPSSKDYAKLLRSIQHRQDANVIQTVLLRSLSQAVYSPDNLGHFGLAYASYCHFTSPIRRYPDLLVHRQIRSVLRGEWTEKAISKSRTDEAKAELFALGAHSSTTERRADEATRDSIRWLKCEYMQKHIGDSFEGIISGVTRFGFFVEIKDLYIDGLVHVTSLKNDYYYFDAIHHRLIGERSGVRFGLGDTVKVKVSRVDVHERKIDFELLEQPKAKKQKSKRSMKKPKRKKRRVKRS